MFSFIETRLFTKLVLAYLSDEEYGALQVHLARNPDAGPAVPGSGGVRKLRWGAAGRGKRGSYRIIYLLRQKIPRRGLATHDVPEERGRQHSGARASADSEGS